MKHVYFMVILLVGALIVGAVENRTKVQVSSGLIDHIEYGDVDNYAGSGPDHYERYHDRATGEEILCFTGHNRLTCFTTGRKW